MRKYLLYLGISIMVAIVRLEAQTIEIRNAPAVCDIAEKIAKQDFDSLVTFSNKLMFDGDSISTANYITMVKIYNSLVFCKPPNLENEDKGYGLFITYFRPAHLRIAIRKTDAVLWKGMGYYSERFNLSIGGTPNERSIFSVQW